MRCSPRAAPDRRAPAPLARRRPATQAQQLASSAGDLSELRAAKASLSAALAGSQEQCAALLEQQGKAQAELAQAISDARRMQA